MKTYTNGKHTFEIVEKIPKNYFIWNIGANMETPDYIPICEKLHPENRESYDINVNTLKCIKLKREDVIYLRKAANYGITNLQKAKRAVKSNPKSNHAYYKKMYAIDVLNVLERITEV